MKKIATKFKFIHIMFLILGIIAIMFLYKNKELNRFNQTSFVQSTTKELEITEGYWLSDNYSFYINEESFILMNNNNYEISYFNILGDYAEKNNIHYSVELVANKSNEVNLFEEAIDISFQQKDEYLTITFNQEEKEMIIDEQFLQITDDHVLSQLVDVVETNGIVIAEKLPELTIDDFKGYWYSFDKNNYEIYPYGTTYIYIDDEYMLSGWSGSDYITLSFN